MKRSFDERQIIGVLQEIRSGITVAALCRKHEISESTYYKWRARFGGMTLSDHEKLEMLEIENAKLKRLLAELMLANEALKEKNGEKMEA
jgi:putative transposase